MGVVGVEATAVLDAAVEEVELEFLFMHRALTEDLLAAGWRAAIFW